MENINIWENEEIGCSIRINYDLCKGSGICVNVCPTGVYELVKGKAAAPRIDECIACYTCVDACPHTAITHVSCG